MEAFRIIMSKINLIKQKLNSVGVNRIETDVQRPSGCFNLKFLSAFTLCYHKITNILVRIGPKPEPTKHSILLNCHFDTLPDTPGATDDAVCFYIILFEFLRNLIFLLTFFRKDFCFHA